MKIFQDIMSPNDTIGKKVIIFLKSTFLPAAPFYKIYPQIRIGMIAAKRGWHFFQRFIELRIFYKFNCSISCYADIGDNLKLPHPLGIVIGMGATIGKNCTIYQQVTIGQNRNIYPKIGNNVIIYSGAQIVGDVQVGDYAIIGSNSLVCHDVPKFAVVGGNPAKILKYRRIEDKLF